MAENASNSSSPSLLRPNCIFVGNNYLIFITFYITNIILLLPLCILIIYLGLQRWRHQRSTSAAAAVTSHSDVFTYHMVTVEMIAVLASVLSCWFFYKKDVKTMRKWYFIWSFTGNGETFFHVLTCVERYLAVVHPVTYLSLRGERGTRIRNISICCVWLLCSVTTGVMRLEVSSLMGFFYLTIFVLIIILFCSFSVLCVLILPGPGEQVGDRGRVDQSKRRAFYTILAILGVLLLKFSGNMGLYVVYLSKNYSNCVMSMSQVWFNLPSSLVLPLLFLHKAGIFACFRNSTK